MLMAYVYSEQFRLKMLRQMVGPNAKSAVQLAAETGLNHSTISRWLQTANGVEDVYKKKKKKKKSKASMALKPMAKRPEDWTAEEKLHVVMEASGLADEELGAFLRERGVHEVHLKDWREMALDSLDHHPRASKGESTRIRKLERELRRKDRALAETAALLVLQKKVNEIWGTSEEEDDDTPPKSDES